MKSLSKILFTVFTVLAVGLLVVGAKQASAQSKEEIIQRLMEQIKALQAQIQALQSGGQSSAARWCHNFNNNLKVGHEGEAVSALHQALGKEGFEFGQDEDETFGEDTASAITGFQEKYKEEILTPNGLKYGTGFAGPATRKKLNSLYGCGGSDHPSPAYDKNTHSSSSSSISSVHINDLSPSSGPVGTEVEITGSGFNWTNNIVYFGDEMIPSSSLRRIEDTTDGSSFDVALEFTVPSSIGPACNSVPRCLAPSRAVTPGVYPVYVSNTNGVSNTVNFTVTAGSLSSSSSLITTTADFASPHIASIKPEYGTADGNTLITIQGKGFLPTASVFFSTPGMATVKAKSVSNDGTVLTFILPNDPQIFTPGTYNVKVANNNGTSFSNSALFTVVSFRVSPRINDLYPSSGPVGKEVQILVSGLDLNLKSDQIYFGGEAVSNFGYINSDVSSNLIFTVPSSIGPACNSVPRCLMPSRAVTPGVYPVYVSNANGVSNVVNFTVTTENSSSSSSPSSFNQ